MDNKRPALEKQQEETTVVIPYVKGLSEKIQRIGRHYNLRTVFKSATTLRNQLTKTKPTTSKDTKNCIYNIPCECGKSYIGETKRPLAVKTKEHKTSTQRGETAKSGIAQHVWDHKHSIRWSEAITIHKEADWWKRKCSFNSTKSRGLQQSVGRNP